MERVIATGGRRANGVNHLLPYRFIMLTNNIFSLPNELLSQLLTDWLEWNAVLQLDSALVCSGNNRGEWLSLLKNDCVFPILHFHWSDTRYKWCAKRCIKARTIYMDSEVSSEDIPVARWLKNTFHVLEELRIYSNFDRPITSTALRVCETLKVIHCQGCVLDEMFWDLLIRNPLLTELRIVECYLEGNETKPLPIDQPLMNVQKLEINDQLIAATFCASLLKLLPALQCVKLHAYYSADIYRILPDQCPTLIQLDLLTTYHKWDVNDAFNDLMKNLKLGLRCLILPALYQFSVREFQCIIDYHAHSLRCLEVGSAYELAPTSATKDIAYLVNNLPNLHTLQIAALCIASLGEAKIVNPSIKHLILLFGWDLNVVFPDLCGHLPALSKLSLLGYANMDAIEKGVTSLVQARSQIRWVGVSCRKDVNRLKTMIAKPISVQLCHGVDIFTQTY